VTVHVLIYSALAIAFVCVCIAQWSVIRMVQEINRLELPGGDRLIRERVSLWSSLPSYRQRHIRKVYRSLQPYSRLRWVYPGSLVVAGLVILAAVLVAAHVPGGVQ
jgi:hypothetical protein